MTTAAILFAFLIQPAHATGPSATGPSPAPAVAAPPGVPAQDLKLLGLVQKGKIPELEAAIKAGFPVNKQIEGPGGPTLLHVAVINGNLPVVKKLLELKADPKTGQRDKPHWTPLHMLAFGAKGGGGVETAKTLLKAGVPATAKDTVGQHPIHLAAQAGNKELIDLFLAEGENVDVKAGAPDQLTPLAVAVLQGDLALVRHLLSKKADPNLALGPGTYLHLAAGPAPSEASGKIAAELLAAGAKVEDPDASGASPLLYAVRKQNRFVAEALLAKKADTSTPNAAGIAPITFATFKNDLEMATLLMKHGADPNRANAKGDSALSMAKGLGHQQLVELFTKK